MAGSSNTSLGGHLRLSFGEYDDSEDDIDKDLLQTPPVTQKIHNHAEDNDGQPDSNLSSLGSTDSTSAGSGSGVTTLELHPNVVLGVHGLGDDDDEQGVEQDRPHLCNICHATYKTRTHLRRHMHIHMNARPFSCSECKKGFNRREHLNKHMEAVHGGSRHHCPYCNKEISRIDHLKRHIKNMHTNKEKVTDDEGAVLRVQMACGQKQKAQQISFLTPQSPIGTLGQTIIAPIPSTNNGGIENLLKLRLESGATAFQPFSSDQQRTSSSKSGEGASSSTMTIIPSNILGPGQTGVATLSIQTTPTQKVLVHQRLPSGSELNAATNGLASLANLNLSLGGQNLSESGNKKALLQIYSCGQCNATFQTEKELSLHIKGHSKHSQKRQPHQCPECSRVYTRREKLTEHIKCVHEGQKFGCEYCGKKLSRKDHVLRHIRSVHPEVYAASLVEIDDGYITLDDHGKLVNTNHSLPLVSPSPKRKRPPSGSGETSNIPVIGDVGVLLRSVCHVCLKVFGTAYHLTRHIESCHSGDVRPFNCTACNKMFKRKDHLTKHLKSHCPSLKQTNHNHVNQASFPELFTDKEKEKSPASNPKPVSDSKSREKVGADQNFIKRLETNLGTSSKPPDNNSSSSRSSDCHPEAHHPILQTLPTDTGNSSKHHRNPANSTPTHHINKQNESGSALNVDGNPHKQSDQNEFNLAVIDTFMQGNVNVVVVDEDISNFLQQNSSSHLTTTTFPCGQCQKEFSARELLIAHLQEHASSDAVLRNGQHMSDLSFADF